MKYVILGHTGSGKSTLADLLAAAGLDVLQSCTTRAPRSEDDKRRYCFMTRDQALAVPDESKVLSTELNGELYFSMRAAVERADVMVLDPSGLREICMQYPDTSFHAVYLTADRQASEDHAALRADDPDGARRIFKSRYESENDRFEQFVSDSYNGFRGWPTNFARLHIYDNDFTEDGIAAMAGKLMSHWTLHGNIAAIVQQCLDLGCVTGSGKDVLELWAAPDADNPEPHIVRLSPDRAADKLLQDDEALTYVVCAWASHHVDLGIPAELRPMDG